MCSQLDLVERFLSSLDRLGTDTGASASNLQAELQELIKNAQLDVLNVLRLVPDERLAEAFQQDFFWSEAFEVLIFERYRPLMEYWYSRSPCHLDPQDLTAEVTVKLLHRGLARYQPQRRFRTWLRTVCRNHLRDALRRRQPALGLAGLPNPPAALGPGPVARAEHGEAARAVGETLKQLDPSDQRVGELYLAGESFEEIASHTQMSTSTAWRRWQRVRALLQMVFQIRFRVNAARD